MYGAIQVMVPLSGLSGSCNSRFELIDNSNPPQVIEYLAFLRNGSNQVSLDVPNGSYRRLNVYMQHDRGPLLCVLAWCGAYQLFVFVFFNRMAVKGRFHH